MGDHQKKRITKNSTEESAIDLVIVSSDMIEHVVNVHIDEEKLNVLTSLTNTQKGVVKHESDDNSNTTKFDIKWSMQDKIERVDIFNFKDAEGQKLNIKSMISHFLHYCKKRKNTVR